MKIVLDEKTPALGDVTIKSELSFEQGVTAELNAEIILRPKDRRVACRLFNHAMRSQLNDHPDIAKQCCVADASSMGTWGILFSGGGKLKLSGTAPTVPWTRLNAHADDWVRPDNQVTGELTHSSVNISF